MGELKLEKDQNLKKIINMLENTLTWVPGSEPHNSAVLICRDVWNFGHIEAVGVRLGAHWLHWNQRRVRNLPIFENLS